MTLLLPSVGVKISGAGRYLPQRVVTNTDIAKQSPIDEDSILKLTGIEERRWAQDNEATSDMAVNAGRAALTAAEREKVDRLILSTTSPDYPSPATACTVQHRLSLVPAPAMDISAACAGFLFGIDLAIRSILTGDSSVLVIASDIRSRFVDPLDYATCALYGDGAGAVVLEPGDKEEGFLAIHLAADGSGHDAIRIPGGGSKKPASMDTVSAREHYLQMRDGTKVFLTALEGMSAVSDFVLDSLDLRLEDIDLIVPHQPNRRILDRLCRYLRVPIAKLFVNVHRTGNMSSASLAVALCDALLDERAKPGALILLLGAGAGFCGGAAIYRVPKK